MSRRQIYQCDSCGKRSDDFLNEPGWLSIEGSKVILTCGRDPHRTAKTLQKNVNGDAHFCKIPCFLTWLAGTHLKDCNVHIDLEVTD